MSAFSKLLDSVEVLPKKVLDVGPGYGRTTVQLKRRFPSTLVVSLDIVRDTCSYLREHINEDVICADATRLPLKDKSFDFVACDQLLEHLTNENELVAELNRVLDEGGYFVCGSVLCRRFTLAIARNKKGKPSHSSQHVREYKSEQEFGNIFKGVFDDIRISVSPFYVFPHITIYRILTRLGLVKWDEQFEQRYDPDFMSQDSLLRKLIMKIPWLGYYYIYAIGKKKAAN